MKRVFSDYFPGILLFLIALLIGMLTHQDYGISWDEPIQRNTGLVSYDYVFNNNDDLLAYQDREYGTGFELPLIIAEKGMHLTDSRDIYLMRHMVTHIFFLVAALFVYVLVFRLYRNKFLACIGFIMLITEPRLYAHSFFNSKDIPFLSILLITLATCQLAFDKNKTILYFILGLLCGYTTSIRVMGVLLTGIILVFLFVDIFMKFINKEKLLKSVLNLLLFPTGFCIALYAAWPYLWMDPIAHFVESYNRMSNFSATDIQTFFMGEFMPFKKAPLTYIIVWFSITTPIVWLFAGFSGALWIIIDFFRRPLTFIGNNKERNFLIYLICFIVPIIAVIVSHSVIYDDWRHLYFVYPAFLMIALYFIHKIFQSKYKLIIQSAVVIQMGIVGYFMILYHPFQQVYFNELVSHDQEYLRKNYEMDYWGACVKQAYDYLLVKYPYGKIKVSSTDFVISGPLKNNILILPDYDRRRIEITKPENADFFITNFRSHPEDFPYPNIEYSIKVLNSTIMCIYRVH